MAQPLDVSFFGPLKNTGQMYTINTCLRTQERLSLNFNFLRFCMRHGFSQFNLKQSDPSSKRLEYTLTSSQITASEEEHSPSNTATQETGDKLNESVCSSSGINLKDSNISFTDDQVSLFQQRYDNGYNLYHDKMYVSWLQQEDPECLPNDLITSTSSSTYSSNTESSGISPLDVQAPTQSLSVSLSQTRSLLSQLSEFLNQSRAPVKTKGKKSTARVLTSAESLSILIEKEMKNKEEEEPKAL